MISSIVQCETNTQYSENVSQVDKLLGPSTTHVERYYGLGPRVEVVSNCVNSPPFDVYGLENP